MNAQETLAPRSVGRHKLFVPSTRENKQTKWKKISDLDFYFFLIGTIDLLLLNAALIGEMVVQVPVQQLAGPQLSSFLGFLLVANAAAIGVASFTDVFRIVEGVRLSLKIRDLFYGAVIYFGIISLIYYQFFFPAFNAHFLLPAFVIFLALSSMVHASFRLFRRNVANKIVYAVVGGDSATIGQLHVLLESVYGTSAVCAGRFGSTALRDVFHLGDFSDVRYFLANNQGISKLFYIDSNLEGSIVRKLSRFCRSQFVDFEVVSREVEFFDQGIQLEQVAHLPVLRRKKEPLYLLKNRLLKRCFDIVFSLAVILFVLSWLYPIIALLIKLESRGPVLFKQMRTGYWSKPFLCLKFRSMRENDECDQKQAVRRDARITRLGNFLRRTSLDELPQFFNVLRGDMSVVGPRPHMLKHTEDYAQLIDTFMIRHQVKPGITGWAQVNGWRGPTGELYQMAKRVEFDVYYIENWSFWFDCRCILLTIKQVFAGEKNAF